MATLKMLLLVALVAGGYGQSLEETKSNIGPTSLDESVELTPPSTTVREDMTEQDKLTKKLQMTPLLTRDSQEILKSITESEKNGSVSDIGPKVDCQSICKSCNATMTLQPDGSFKCMSKYGEVVCLAPRVQGGSGPRPCDGEDEVGSVRGRGPRCLTTLGKPSPLQDVLGTNLNLGTIEQRRNEFRGRLNALRTTSPVLPPTAIKPSLPALPKIIIPPVPTLAPLRLPSLRLPSLRPLRLLSSTLPVPVSPYIDTDTIKEDLKISPEKTIADEKIALPIPQTGQIITQTNPQVNIESNFPNPGAQPQFVNLRPSQSTMPPLPAVRLPQLQTTQQLRDQLMNIRLRLLGPPRNGLGIKI